MFHCPRFPVLTHILFLPWVALTLLFTACSSPFPASPPPSKPSAVSGTRIQSGSLTPSALPTSTAAASLTPTLTASVTVTALLTPTSTKVPTATSTPEPLEIFQTRLLRPGVVPLAYLDDICQYLDRRWAEDGSPPGTVVVPVMFHSIVRSGRTVSDPKDISEEQFQGFVSTANYFGFKTITTDQLVGFLERNEKIPERSMILILDDRRPGVVRDNFLPVLEANDWTLTLAYIADPNTMGWAMDEIERLYESGRLDVQSHGYSGQLYIVDQTPVEEIQHEIWESTPVLEDHFSQRPQAFIWPGGNFNFQAVQIARQGGYKLGFTAYSRGPVLFNWVPQGELEQQIADPLMLLPRAWSNSAVVNLDEGIRIGDLVREDARQRYSQEEEYYRTYCGGELPSLEKILSPLP